MTSIKHKTKAELLLIAAVALTVAACSGGKKSGTATTEVTDNVVLDLPEGRALEKQEIKKSEESLFEVGTTESGTDVNADTSTSLGHKILGELNVLSTKTESVEDINLRVDELVKSLLENDVKKAKVAFSKAELAAKSRRETRQNEVTKSFGGVSAIDALTFLKESADKSIANRTKKAKELVALVSTLEDRYAALSTAKSSRDGEIKELQGAIKVLEEKVKAIKENRVDTLEAQNEVRKTEIDVLNEQIQALRSNIAEIESEFNSKFQKRKDEMAARGWWTRNISDPKSASDIKQEVLNLYPDLKRDLHLSETLKAKLKAALDKKKQVSAAIKPADIAKVTVPSEVQAELDNLKQRLAAYSVTVRTYVPAATGMFNPSATGTTYVNTTDFYLFEGKMISSVDLNAAINSSLAQRTEALASLRKMDPNHDERVAAFKKGDDNKILEEAVSRSAAYYEKLIREAFKKELADFAKLQASRKAVDDSFGTEVQSAESELKKAESFLAEYSARISSGLKVVTGCQEVVLADKDSSERTLVDSISTDAKKTLVTSLVTFQDYFKEETQGEYDASKNISYTNSDDYNRFVYLMMNEKNEVIGFKTVGALTPSVKKIVGVGTTSVEYRDPNDGEKPTFIKGDVDFSVNEFKSSFATPVAALEGNAFTVAVCVQKKDGKFEYRTRKVIVRDVKTPVSTSAAQ